MSIKDSIPLNLDMMANPYNWVVITLMVLIAGLALSLLFPQSANTDQGGT